MEYKISEKLAQAILQYLAGGPYAEVFQLVNGLQSLEKVTPDTEKTDKTAK